MLRLMPLLLLLMPLLLVDCGSQWLFLLKSIRVFLSMLFAVFAAHDFQPLPPFHLVEHHHQNVTAARHSHHRAGEHDGLALWHAEGIYKHAQGKKTKEKQKRGGGQSDRTDGDVSQGERWCTIT